MAPVRYWFRYNFRNTVILPIKWKYENISNWVRYRTYDKHHVVNTGLRPDYHSVSKIILHSNFNILKDFVEVEQAWHIWCFSDERRNKKTWIQRWLPWYFRHAFRRPELGIEHLKWAATLDDPLLPLHERCDHQAAAAREIFALYDWWVNKRPARIEINIPSLRKNSGKEDLLDFLDTDFDRTTPVYRDYQIALEKQAKLEEVWENEDEEMLIRLMKIRNHLWT